MPDVEIRLTSDKANIYWQAALWTENEDHSGQTAKSILIDAKTGKVTTPDYQLMSIYLR